ncbi:hypothetical protein HELRODRAFT_173379 [Helobdella robusta]|uniref:PID domain-containing protein n=1 Tax=Helobdella robusta TaxID=6412 RepID=T1F6R0_HELRO|nr:hypothetical protein HELRODRAFT_173379 [Helobdella robusta]ESO03681.1 hypothetical protein HELRODRAFT_173379 [Helobdella robusta]
MSDNTSRDVPMYSLGKLEKISLQQQNGDRDKDIQLIDRVEEAQLNNKLVINPKQSDLINFKVSINGIVVKDRSGEVVIHRFPLHAIAQIVYYNDPNDKSNLVFKVGSHDQLICDCYVFQCIDDVTAVDVCEKLKLYFDISLNS